MQRSSSAFARPPALPPLALERTNGAPGPPLGADDPLAVLDSMRRHYLRLLSISDALPHPHVAASPTDPMRALSKRKARAMTSSERGVKFRRKQQARQEQLEAATDGLRREIARLEALRALRRAGKLSASVSEGGAPLRFVLEYFAQFRFGVADEGAGPAMVATSSTVRQQVDFLRAMVSPDALFNGVPAVQFVIESFSHKKKLASFRVERESSELLVVDKSVVVVSRGVSHMRYSRHSIEQMFPHVLSNEELVRKLVGRQLHMPFKTTMFFDEHGQLARGEFERDPVIGLYEVLRSMEDCAALLGDKAVQQSLESQRRSRLERRQECAADAGRFEELVAEPNELPAPVDARLEQPCQAQSSPPPAASMDINFILS